MEAANLRRHVFDLELPFAGLEWRALLEALISEEAIDDAEAQDVGRLRIPLNDDGVVLPIRRADFHLLQNRIDYYLYSVKFNKPPSLQSYLVRVVLVLLGEAGQQEGRPLRRPPRGRRRGPDDPRPEPRPAPWLRGRGRGRGAALGVVADRSGSCGCGRGRGRNQGRRGGRRGCRS